MPVLNIHTHYPSADPQLLEIESLYFGQSAPGSSPWRSAGLHPWYLDFPDLGLAEHWLREQAARPGALAIGEAGLDKHRGAAWPLQVQAFECCLRVAADTRKPLVLHCVKAHDEVLGMLRRYALPAVFHGFDKHPQLAARLWEAGYGLSFGAALFNSRSHAAEALRQTPADHFFLETDDKKLDIRAVYERAAAIRGSTPEKLQAQVWENFQNIGGSILLPGKNDDSI